MINQLTKTENLLDIYFHSATAHMAKNTVKVYRIALNRLHQYASTCPRESGEKYERWLVRIADSYLNSQKYMTKSTFTLDKRVISAFYTWVYKYANLEYNPGRMLSAKFNPDPFYQDRELKKRKVRSNSVLSENDISTILRVTKMNTPRDYIMFLMGFNFALRTDDLAHIQRKHFIKNEHGEPQLVLWGKTERRKRTPTILQIDPPSVYDICINYMDEWGLVDDEDYLITKFFDTFNPDDGITREPINADAISRRIKKVTEDILGRPISGHYLRRSRVTNLLQLEHVSLRQISKLARMSDTIILQHYDCQPNRHNLGDTAIL